VGLVHGVGVRSEWGGGKLNTLFIPSTKVWGWALINSLRVPYLNGGLLNSFSDIFGFLNIPPNTVIVSSITEGSMADLEGGLKEGRFRKGLKVRI